jgi:1-acyl-sn-glycerol-3-phosphate acyltransferase
MSDAAPVETEQQAPIPPLPLVDGTYRSPVRTPSILARLFPSLYFYSQFLWIVRCAGATAKRSVYGYREWSQSSRDVLEALEAVGVRFEITGIERLLKLQTPFLTVGNHMSTLETAVLPCVIQPFHDVTFIVKQSLLEYPVFKYVMRSRDPVAVSQTNPREDLKTMLVEGSARLQRGVSLVVFPGGSRQAVFEPARFNTIGVKIAQRTGAPIVPLALDTRAWGIGKWIPDFGYIDPTRTVRIEFGEPLTVHGRGAEEHRACLDFIQSRLRQWGVECEPAAPRSALTLDK